MAAVTQLRLEHNESMLKTVDLASTPLHLGSADTIRKRKLQANDVAIP
jgi:hypothetical protein